MEDLKRPITLKRQTDYKTNQALTGQRVEGWGGGVEWVDPELLRPTAKNTSSPNFSKPSERYSLARGSGNGRGRNVEGVGGALNSHLVSHLPAWAAGDG